MKNMNALTADILHDIGSRYYFSHDPDNE